MKDIKIVGNQLKDGDLYICIFVNGEEFSRCEFDHLDAAGVVYTPIIQDDYEICYEKNEDNRHRKTSELRFMLELGNSIALNMIMKLEKSGFIWSEMRIKCEIDIQLDYPVYNLTYRKTGMNQSNVRVADCTGALYDAIRSILFD